MQQEISDSVCFVPLTEEESIDWGLPWWCGAVVKNLPANAGDTGSSPGQG